MERSKALISCADELDLKIQEALMEIPMPFVSPEGHLNNSLNPLRELSYKWRMEAEKGT